MSPSHVLEPTYLRLKQLLMQGHWPIGYRLEAVRLADDLGVSMTPVRDCLNRLVGERLVDLRPGEGFRVARLNERALRDLFEFNAALLIFAIHVSAPLIPPAAETSDADDHAGHVAILFSAMAERADNGALSASVASLNDRLHPVRRLDPLLVPGCDNEIAEMAQKLRDGAKADHLRHHVAQYHDIRQAAVPRYLEVLERGRD